MWISRKKWKALKKRVAGLEKQLQDQQQNKEISFCISYGDANNLVKKQDSKRHIDRRTACL